MDSLRIGLPICKTPRVTEILTDAQTMAQLKIKLAAIVDAGKPMVESTEILEGSEMVPKKNRLYFNEGDT